MQEHLNKDYKFQILPVKEIQRNGYALLWLDKKQDVIFTPKYTKIHFIWLPF